MHVKSPLRIAVALTMLAFGASACSSPPSANTGAATTSASATSALYDASALPAGPLGQEIRLGHDVIDNPAKYLKGDVTANMTCSSCHIAAGTVPRGASLAGVYARFPQYNKRSKRVIALQDRLAECFLYSMNGRAPAYTSKEMIAMVAYLAYISRDVPVGAPKAKADSFAVTVPSTAPDVAKGGQLYTQKCATCHQANGAGVSGTFPPLWGATSFNNGAGMAKLANMTGFVKYNMPQNAPGTLSVQEAYDISAFVLSHPRPKFKGSALMSSPPLPAKFF